jgi:ABC-2 type transport system ATP-binding protein
VKKPLGGEHEAPSVDQFYAPTQSNLFPLLFFPMAMSATREIIHAEAIGKRFGDTIALENVSFAIDGPGIVGVLGPNGAGKTTLLDILEGLSTPTSGKYRLFGKPAHPYPRQRVGVVMQKEAHLERITVREYAELFSVIFGVKSGAKKILEQARLAHRERTPVTRLSGGEAARLYITTAVVHEPDLVFLDEPTAHLDPENKRIIGDLLRDLAQRRTLFLTTHDLYEADVLCDKLLFLVDGRVRATGTKDELVAGVPQDKRRGIGVEDAFFHFCAIRIERSGNVLERAE